MNHYKFIGTIRELILRRRFLATTLKRRRK